MDVQSVYQRWLGNPHLSDDLKADLVAIANNEKEIHERFYRDLEFGTGGLRGVLGAGTNRMNVYTVRRATLGFAQYLRSITPTGVQPSVAIGYDCRHMSKEFALEAGLTMAAAGVKAFVFPHLCPTPVLSFAVRTLHAQGGIMVTASHNPPEYNGYKAYGADGGQLLPEAAADVIQRIEAIADIFAIPMMSETDAQANGLLSWIGSDLDELYLETVRRLVMAKTVVAADRSALKVVYTPLHGTGYIPIRDVLHRASYSQTTIVASQAEPDGNFPTVKSPNPEEPEALHLAVEEAKKLAADIVIGTDPDADRVGIAVRSGDGQYQLFTGNQTGALILDFLLQDLRVAGQLPGNGIVFKTIVTSEIGAAVARKHGIAVEDTLTGFKYIGDRIGQYERTGEHTFLFGYEESYGYLIRDFVRDKDAVQTALVIAEMAAWYKSRGETLVDGLHRLFGELGWYREKLVSVTMPGADGMAKITQSLDDLRRDPLDVNGLTLLAIEDYESRTRRDRVAGAPISHWPVSKLELPQSDVLRYLFEGGSWLAVRPSGTEPKMKIYLGATGPTEQACADVLSAMNDAIGRLMPK